MQFENDNERHPLTLGSVTTVPTYEEKSRRFLWQYCVCNGRDIVTP